MSRLTALFKDAATFEKIWKSLSEKYKQAEFFSGNPEWQDEPGSMNILGVRHNKEISFNTKEDGFNNDWLFIWEKDLNGEVSIYEFEVTMDPLGKKNNIAHLRKGAWNSYVIRGHKWIPSRTAFGQDANDVLVTRTDAKGNVLTSEWGKFGINIHDSGGYKNSSLGCTILAKDEIWKTVFKPLLLKHKSLKKTYTYVVTDLPDLYLEILKHTPLDPKLFMDVSTL